MLNNGHILIIIFKFCIHLDFGNQQAKPRESKNSWALLEGFLPPPPPKIHTIVFLNRK